MKINSKFLGFTPPFTPIRIGSSDTSRNVTRMVCYENNSNYF